MKPIQMPLHRRILYLSGHCSGDSYLPCSPPAPAPPLPSPAPAPPPPPIISPSPCFVGSADISGGAADNRRLVNVILIAASLIAAVSLLSLILSIWFRRRRRLRLFLLHSSPADPATGTAAGGGGSGSGDSDSNSDNDSAFHHVWYIRTVGLDEAAIQSITVAEHRGGGDCAVCLGEFGDGDLVRLLPKCGHAFHVPCIDTWLRAHVNCPLCRAAVLIDSTVSDAADYADDDAQVEPQDEEREDERETIRVIVDQFSSPDVLPRPQPARRAASMDLALVSAAAAADVAAMAKETTETTSREEQSSSSKEKQGNTSYKVSASGHFDVGRSLSSTSYRRSFFSRHGRARSSVLPL